MEAEHSRTAVQAPPTPAVDFEQSELVIFANCSQVRQQESPTGAQLLVSLRYTAGPDWYSASLATALIGCSHLFSLSLPPAPHTVLECSLTRGLPAESAVVPGEHPEGWQADGRRHRAAADGLGQGPVPEVPHTAGRNVPVQVRLLQLLLSLQAREQQSGSRTGARPTTRQRRAACAAHRAQLVEEQASRMSLLLLALVQAG